MTCETCGAPTGWVEGWKLERANESKREAMADVRDLLEENQRLKDALFFWLPNIPAVENECTDRMANDAALLIGHEGRIDDSAEQRGWITLTPNDQVVRPAACGRSEPTPGSAAGDSEKG